MSDPRIPSVGEKIRMVGKLVRIDTPEPVQPPDEYVFEDVDARVELRFDGQVLNDCGTFNDFYGCSVETGIVEARKTAESRGLTSSSEIEVVVVVKITNQRRRHLSKDKEPWSYDREFRRFRDLDGYPGHYGLEPTREEDVWSSKRWLKWTRSGDDSNTAPDGASTKEK